MFTAMVPILTPISRDHNKKLVKIIQALLAYEQSNIFRKPIPHKALGWEDYKDIVKKPTDINYVRRQYNEGKYKFVEQVLDQLQLVWDNVFMYDKKQHETYNLAIKMQKNFDNLINDYLPEYYQKINRVEYFKQFQHQKREKRNTSLPKEQKNYKKTQKMDIEGIKEQAKIEREPNINMPKKRQSLNSRRAQSNTQLTIPGQHENREIPNQQPKKGTEIQSNRVTENRRTSNSAKINTNIIEVLNTQTKQSESLRLFQVKNQVQAMKKQTKVTINEQQVEKKPIEPSNKNENIPDIQLFSNQAYKPLQPQCQVLQQPQKVELNIEPIQNEDSQQNQYPPIIVTLNKTPSQEKINQLTNIMNLLVQINEFDTLSKVVRILTKYEKQNMVIDGQDVNFRMNEIHISTYNRIKKELETKMYQLEQAERVKDLVLLMAKHNIKSYLIDQANPSMMANGVEGLQDQQADQAQNQNHQHIIMQEVGM